MSDVDGAIRSVRIVVVGIFGGLVMMAAVAVFLRPQMAPGFPAQARTGLLALADGLGD